MIEDCFALLAIRMMKFEVLRNVQSSERKIADSKLISYVVDGPALKCISHVKCNMKSRMSRSSFCSVTENLTPKYFLHSRREEN